MGNLMTIWAYIFNSLALFMIFGVAWYFADRRYGIRLYRHLYDLCHPSKPMPADVVRGFMFKQPTKRKAHVAFCLSTVQSIYMIWGTEVNLLVEIVLWILEVPAMLVGFWLGTLVYKLYERRNQAFEAIDQAEKTVSELDLDQLRKDAETRGEQLATASRGLVGSLGAAVTKPLNTLLHRKPVQQAEKSAAPAPEPEPDPREIIRRYTEGRS